MPVNFCKTFTNTVSYDDAFPRGDGPSSLLPLFNLEIWGAPTSKPTRDPKNNNFVYLRFQRGIMHYDDGCKCTQGLLLGDYLKALMTGENLPIDLEAQAKDSPLLRQYQKSASNGLAARRRSPEHESEGRLREVGAGQATAAAAAAPARPASGSGGSQAAAPSSRKPLASTGAKPAVAAPAPAVASAGPEGQEPRVRHERVHLGQREHD